MRMFGLIGFPLSHSFSKKYFSDKFAGEGINDCKYENFEISSIGQLEGLLQETPFLEGLNVTIPYKQQVLPFLHWKNDVVEATGACNCILIEGGRLYGFNTDATGFEQSLKKKLLPHHKKALVLGTGGAARAVAYVLDKLQIEFLYVSRNSDGITGRLFEYGEITKEIMRSHTLIINTTPLGMYPQTNTFPPLNYELLGPKHYLYDLVYNPEKTRFLCMGEEQGTAIENGHGMLMIQAEESWKIWNSNNP